MDNNGWGWSLAGIALGCVAGFLGYRAGQNRTAQSYNDEVRDREIAELKSKLRALEMTKANEEILK
jgi:hypothetical protein